MRGSLDQPPIVIRASRWKSALYLLICALFAGIGAFALVLEGARWSLWWAYVSIVCFGAGAILFAWRFVRPDSLVLSPQGIEWRSLWRTNRWSWREVIGFRVVPLGPATRQVGFDFTPDYPRSQRLRRINAGLVGIEGSFGGGWELGATKLCELLAAARAKWFAS